VIAVTCNILLLVELSNMESMTHYTQWESVNWMHVAQGRY